MEGYPIDVESTPSFTAGRDCKDPTRLRLLDMKEADGFSGRRSSNVRVLGRDCDSLLEEGRWFEGCLEAIGSGRDLPFVLK